MSGWCSGSIKQVVSYLFIMFIYDQGQDQGQVYDVYYCDVESVGSIGM